MAVLANAKCACTTVTRQGDTVLPGFAWFLLFGLCSVQASCGWLKHDDNSHQL